MIWESWSHFFGMGGYALYVWGSVIVVFGCLVAEVLILILRGKSIRTELAKLAAVDPSRTGKNR